MENGALLDKQVSGPICSTPMHLLECQWDPHSPISDIINPPKQSKKMKQTSPLHFNLSALNKICAAEMRNFREDNVWSNHIQHWDKTYCISYYFFFPDLPQKFLKFQHRSFSMKSLLVKEDLEEEMLYFFRLFILFSSTHGCLRNISSPYDSLMNNIWPLEQLSLSIFKSEHTEESTCIFLLIVINSLHNTFPGTDLCKILEHALCLPPQKKYKGQKCIGRKIKRNFKKRN